MLHAGICQTLFYQNVIKVNSNLSKSIYGPIYHHKSMAIAYIDHQQCNNFSAETMVFGQNFCMAVTIHGISDVEEAVSQLTEGL